MRQLHGFCRSCSTTRGLVRVDPRDVTLCIDGETGKVMGYFVCPRCLNMTSGPVSSRVEELLTDVNLQMSNPMPALDPRYGLPITAADVLKFRNEINGFRV